MRQVVLVCGPPCAGKSTWVSERVASDDVVVDFDDLARRLGSHRKWQHSQSISDEAERWAQDLIDRVGAVTEGRAWVIRTAPESWRRQGLTARLRADRVIVLKPAMAVLMARARARPLPKETTRAILRWFDRYEPASIDEVVA